MCQKHQDILAKIDEIWQTALQLEVERNTALARVKELESIIARMTDECNPAKPEERQE